MAKLYTVTQAAERLGVHPTTVNRWIQDGAFPNAYKLRPTVKQSPYRIPESDIASLEQQRQAAN